MPRPVPTTLRLRSSRSSPRGQPVPHVPNRPLRFPRSTPPPEPSARPSGFSVRSQRDSLGLNPQMINGSRSYPRCREVQSRRATHSLSQAPPVCQKYRRGGVPAAPDVWMFGCLGVWIRSSSTIHHSPLILHTFPRQVRRRPPQARSGDTVLRVPHAQREGYRTARSEFHKYAWHTCGHATCGIGPNSRLPIPPYT